MTAAPGVVGPQGSGTYGAGGLVTRVGVVQDVLGVVGHGLVVDPDGELVVVADVDAAVLLAGDAGAVTATRLPGFF